MPGLPGGLLCCARHLAIGAESSWTHVCVCVCVLYARARESVCECHFLICAYLQIDQESKALRFSRDANSFHESVLRHTALIYPYVVRECLFVFFIYIVRFIINYYGICVCLLIGVECFDSSFVLLRTMRNFDGI